MYHVDTEGTVRVDSNGDRYVVLDGCIQIPEWIEQDRITTGNPDHLDIHALEAVACHGCDSGAYMPAVTYGDAADTMNENGDDVVAYVQDWHEQVRLQLKIPHDSTWNNLATFFLSRAVEIWTQSVLDTIEDWDEETKEDIDDDDDDNIVAPEECQEEQNA